MDRAERGATVILIAIMITALFAVAALAVDVSAMHLERRELQGAADAAALAIAEDCARTTCTDLGVVAATAETFADANSGDSATRVLERDAVR